MLLGAGHSCRGGAPPAARGEPPRAARLYLAQPKTDTHRVGQATERSSAAGDPAGLVVVPVPCLRDNYAYLCFREGGGPEAIVVDACEAEPIRAELLRRGLRLSAILSTHHHADHVGGNRELVSWARRSGEVVVYGHESETARIPELTRTLKDGDAFEVLGLELRALHVPGHTLGALTYLTAGHAFTGDTLFTAGAGRMFEGTYPVFYRSVCELLGALPPETMLYTGHEYTEANLRFALSLEPEHRLTQERVHEVAARRARAEVTAMAPLEIELQTNPFLRVLDPAYRERLGLGDATAEQAFAWVRRTKDGF